MNRSIRKRTFGRMCPAKIQISLRIRAVWSESSLGAFGIANDANFLNRDNKDSDQTVKMRRPIWVYVGRTCQKVRFLTYRLKLCSHILLHRCIVNCFICSRLCVLVLQISQTRFYITVLQICWVVWWTLTCCSNKMCRNVKKSTFWHVLPTKTQIRLRMRAVWLKSSLSEWKKLCILGYPKCAQ